VTPLRLREALWRHASLPLSTLLRQTLVRLDGPDSVAVEPPSLLPKPVLVGGTRPYRRMVQRDDLKIVAAEGHPSASFLSSMLRGRAQAYPLDPDEPALEVTREPSEAEQDFDQDFEPGSEFDAVPEGPSTLRTGAVVVEVDEEDGLGTEGSSTGSAQAMAGDAAFSPPPPQTAPDEPAPQPVADEPAPQPVADEPAPQPVADEPAPQPIADEPAPPLVVEATVSQELPEEDDLHQSEPGAYPPFLHRGPFTREMAERALGEANDTQELLEVFARFARQFFERVVLFTVQAGRAEARITHGMPAPVVTLQTPLDQPGMLKHALDTAGIVVAVLGEEGHDADLRAALGTVNELEAVVVPVCVRQRVVALLYADDSSVGIDRDAVAEVAGFANLLGNALAMQIVRRKRGAKG
jgi:hypothetical protein